MKLPRENQFINIHSHRKAANEHEWSLRNAFHMLDPEEISEVDYAVSVGLHPWMADDHWKEELKNIERLLILPNVIAIGEAGIDRAIKTPVAQQIEAFEAQLKLAVSFKKPMIVHAVRSYSDLIPICKKYNEIDFILHDYRGNEQQTKELLKLSNVNFSFGRSLFKQDSKETSIFQSLPADRFFLETDNEPLLISDVYQIAASLRNIEISELKIQVFNTFARVFTL